MLKISDVIALIKSFVAPVKSAINGMHTVPSGGSSGQVLGKASGTDYDVEWKSVSGGGVIDASLSLTSENPVQNKVITGENNKNIALKQDYDVGGKNLLNYGSPYNINGYFMLANGTYTSANTYFVSHFIPVEAGESYAIRTGTGSASYHGWYKANGELISTFASAGSTGAVVTAPENAVFLKVSANVNVAYGQVEKGSSITSYEPFITKKMLHEQADSQDVQIKELIAVKDDYETISKNLLNVGSKYTISGHFLKSDGGFAANANYHVSNYIPVEGNTSYAINTGSSSSTYCAWYDSDFNLISTFACNGSTAVVQTSPATAKYLRVSILASTATAQVEKGSSASAYEEYVTKKVIYDTVLANGINNIVHGVYDYEHQTEVSPSSYTANSYMNASGNVTSNNSYRYSDKLTVVPGELCEFYKDNEPAKARFVTAFNSNNTAVSSKGSNDAIKTYVVPEGITSIIISVTSGDEVWKVKRTPPNRVLNGETANEQIESATVRENTLIAKADTLSNGSKLVCGQNCISTQKRLAFRGYFETFVGVIVGHGYTEDSLGSWLEITATKATVYRRWDGETQQMGDYTHGLTMKDYISVIILAGYGNKAKIVIYTNGGTYTINDVYWYGRQGEIFALANGNAFTNASCAWNCPLTRKKIWAYGDSYFDTASDRKWNYYLEQLGIHSVMWDDNSGRASLKALESLKNDLKLGTPKFILWAMGMNDTEPSGMNANWKNCVDELLAICSEHEITPILCTIPSTTSMRNTYKNAWIEESGYRYIDFAKAVGGEEYPSPWYEDMLFEDGIHPAVQGAIALFNQAITDFPELLDDEP